MRQSQERSRHLHRDEKETRSSSKGEVGFSKRCAGRRQRRSKRCKRWGQEERQGSQEFRERGEGSCLVDELVGACPTANPGEVVCLPSSSTSARGVSDRTAIHGRRTPSPVLWQLPCCVASMMRTFAVPRVTMMSPKRFMNPSCVKEVSASYQMFLDRMLPQLMSSLCGALGRTAFLRRGHLLRFFFELSTERLWSRKVLGPQVLYGRCLCFTMEKEWALLGAKMIQVRYHSDIF